MSLHAKPEYNTPKMVAAMRAHGIDPETPSQVADAFRLGFMAASPDWKPQRCEGCDCEFGGADCSIFKHPARATETETD